MAFSPPPSSAQFPTTSLDTFKNSNSAAKLQKRGSEKIPLPYALFNQLDPVESLAGPDHGAVHTCAPRTVNRHTPRKVAPIRLAQVSLVLHLITPARHRFPRNRDLIGAGQHAGLRAEFGGRVHRVRWNVEKENILRVVEVARDQVGGHAAEDDRGAIGADRRSGGTSVARGRAALAHAPHRLASGQPVEAAR